MAQLQKGQTFTDGEQVTGVRLNQLVDASTLQTGSITEQAAHTANTVAADDMLLVFDASAGAGTPPSGALVKTQASSLLASNLPVIATTVTTGTATVPVINSSAGSDLGITAYDGTLKTLKAFASTDGILVTVTDTAHGLVTGQIVTFSSASNLPSIAYNGTYSITRVDADKFTYTLSPTSTAASGTISYQKKATVVNTGNKTISGELKVAGNTTVGGNLVIAGSITQSGGGTQTGNITQTGTVTQSGAVNQSGTVTQSGTVNVTGVIQYNGIPVYGMTEVLVSTTLQTISGIGACHTFNNQTKTSDEIWVIDFVIYNPYSDGGVNGVIAFNTTEIVSYTSTPWNPLVIKYVINQGTVFSATSIRIYSTSGYGIYNPAYASITKYKTA